MIRNKLLNLFASNAKRGSFKAEANTIYIYDVIVGSDMEAEWFGGVAPKAFIDTLNAMSGDVHLRINSPGGDVFAANAMVQCMRDYTGGKIIAHIDGVAASAASVLAVAADTVIMAPGSLMMIHNAWTMAMGDRHDLTETANLLEKVDGMLADNYAVRSGGDTGTFATMMDAETWFTPQEAVDIGLADEVAADKPKPTATAMATWDLSIFNAAPVITKTTTETTCTETEVVIETVEVISGDPATIPEDNIDQRARKHAVAMILTAA